MSVPVPVRQIADYLLAKADDDAGDLISNLKLQKLLYYSQGFHLALTDQPLFSEPIVSWTHGPVVTSIYHEFKDCGQGGIPRPSEVPVFDEDTAELLDEVYKVYGQYSAWKLRNLTHDEPPWKEARSGEALSLDRMREYFKTQLIRE